jgi:hypothetical protein
VTSDGGIADTLQRKQVREEEFTFYETWMERYTDIVSQYKTTYLVDTKTQIQGQDLRLRDQRQKKSSFQERDLTRGTAWT